MKPDITVINRVIYYSILQRDVRITLLQLRKSMIMIRGLGFTIPSFNDLKDVEIELMRRSKEITNACKLLLQPLLEGVDFGHNYLDHWGVSMYDIKRGYCELEEILQYNNHIPIRFGRKFILLLEDYKDSTLGNFYGGELIELDKAIHFINDIPEKKDKLKGLYDAILNSIDLAVKYRSSKNIPNV